MEALSLDRRRHEEREICRRQPCLGGYWDRKEREYWREECRSLEEEEEGYWKAEVGGSWEEEEQGSPCQEVEPEGALEQPQG